jgi:transposase
MPKKQPSYPDEYKRKIIELMKSGKKKSDILREYGMSRGTLDRWIEYESKSGSFKVSDNRSESENELIELRKENKRLLMENDILKQAALIMGKR